MDLADRAQLDMELHLQNKLNSRESGMVKTGRCYNCEEEIDKDLFFCDKDCRDDYEKRNRK